MADEKKAFVIMPFAEEHNDVLTFAILPAMTECGYTVVRADNLTDQNILRRIMAGMATSDIVIAVISGLNANVMYELGLAHGLCIAAVVLTDDIDAVPFDLRSYQVLPYSSNVKDVEKLKVSLQHIAKTKASGNMAFSSPLEFIPDDAPIVPLGTVNDAQLTNVLASVVRSLRGADPYKHAVFRRAVYDDCARFRGQAARWARGELLAQRRQYNYLLLQLYERAEESVFSTSIPAYMSAWNQKFGDLVLATHKKSPANVERVFVYSDRNEVTHEAVAKFKRQAKRGGVDVRLYFEDEDQSYDFPSDLYKDFTIIDNGAAIGVTMSFGGQGLSAEWYFDNDEMKGRYLSARKELLRLSEKLPDFLDWWQENRPADELDVDADEAEDEADIGDTAELVTGGDSDPDSSSS